MASACEMIPRMELDRINDWLWCLRNPIVQAYAVRERDGFNLIDTCTAGQDGEIMEILATIDGQAGPVRIYEILLTHGHDDHTGSAAALAERTGARVLAARDEAPTISRDRPAAPEVRIADQIRIEASARTELVFTPTPAGFLSTSDVEQARAALPQSGFIKRPSMSMSRTVLSVARPTSFSGHGGIVPTSRSRAASSRSVMARVT